MKIKDCLWIWGQDPGTHSGEHYRIPDGNTIDPVEGAAILGIPNCCRVVMHGHPEPPFDREAEKLKGFKKIIWSGLGDGGSTRNNNGHDDVDEVIRIAKKFPNVKGCILDDFFLGDNPRISQERMAEIQRSLRAENLSLWMVSYDLKRESFKQNKHFFDGISFWTWVGDHIEILNDNMDLLVASCPDQTRIAGCYMWDYHNRRELSDEQMKKQCDIYHQRLLKGDIHGVIICTNCVLGLGIKSEQFIKNWIAEIGDEEIPSTSGRAWN